MWSKKLPKSSQAKLEKKVCLAKEIPEPVFDVSECELNVVPKGTYVLCRVMRKEQLYLQTNFIKDLTGGGDLSDLSLLKTLDLRNNEIVELPPDIKHLVNLKELYVDNNKLSSLPDDIKYLSNLESLTLSSNNLLELPDSISELRQLKLLDLRYNPALSSLPSSLKLVRSIKQLKVDVRHDWKIGSYVLEEPISSDTILVTLQMLNQQDGITTVNKAINSATDGKQREIHFRYVKGKFEQIQQLKDEKNNKLLKIQQDMLEETERQAGLQNRRMEERDKLLEELVVDQCNINSNVLVCQENRQKQQSKFVCELLKVEKAADNTIRQVTEANRIRILDNMDSNILTKIQLLQIQDDEVQRKNSRKSMSGFINGEWCIRSKYKEVEQFRKMIVHETNLREKMMDENLRELLLKKKENSEKMVAAWIKDNLSLQETSVSDLLEESDARSIVLKSEIYVVQNELSNLIEFQMEKKDLLISKHINDLEVRKDALAQLLANLEAKKDERRRYLVHDLIDMEQNLPSTEEKAAFWLTQYRRLLDCRPNLMIRANQSLRPQLIYNIAVLGGIHCLPFLVMCNATSNSELAAITDDKLKEVGMIHLGERQLILRAIHDYLNMNIATAPELEDIIAPPSAPLLSEISSSSQCFIEDECTICVFEKSRVIFLPCGHLCTCEACSITVVRCPLCRQDIKNRISE